MRAAEAKVTDVLIAGAGPAGLTVAIELGRRGISCQVVEEWQRVQSVAFVRAAANWPTWASAWQPAQVL